MVHPHPEADYRVIRRSTGSPPVRPGRSANNIRRETKADPYKESRCIHTTYPHPKRRQLHRQKHGPKLGRETEKGGSATASRQPSPLTRKPDYDSFLPLPNSRALDMI